MAMRIGGSRRKTRHKMQKNVRDHGKIKLSSYLDEFKTGDRVCLATEPSVHEGLYHSRFHGKIGTVVSKKGSCYYVQIKDINMAKKLIVHPVHLKRV
jgi:large subunit ribosomal protein L21e